MSNIRALALPRYHIGKGARARTLSHRGIPNGHLPVHTGKSVVIHGDYKGQNTVIIWDL